LKIHGTKERANLYVTHLTQILYTMEELADLQTEETYTDDRYKLIQGNNLVFLNYVNIFFS